MTVSPVWLVSNTGQRTRGFSVRAEITPKHQNSFGMNQPHLKQSICKRLKVVFFKDQNTLPEDYV